MHPAGVPELAHTSINDGEAGLTSLPGAQVGFVKGPGEQVISGLEGEVLAVWKVVEEVGGEFSPIKLTQDAGVCLFLIRTATAYGMEKLLWADLTKVQVGGESAGAVRIR